MSPHLRHVNNKVKNGTLPEPPAGASLPATECWRHGRVSPPRRPRCIKTAVCSRGAGVDIVACIRRHVSGQVDGADRAAAGGRSGSLRLLGGQVGCARQALQGQRSLLRTPHRSVRHHLRRHQSENGKKIRCRCRIAGPTRAAVFSTSRSAPRARSAAMVCAASPCAAPATNSGPPSQQARHIFFFFFFFLKKNFFFKPPHNSRAQRLPGVGVGAAPGYSGRAAVRSILQELIFNLKGI